MNKKHLLIMGFFVVFGGIIGANFASWVDAETGSQIMDILKVVVPVVAVSAAIWSAASSRCKPSD